MSKSIDDGTNGENKKVDKGKFMYMTTITKGAPRESPSFKETMKRKIFEILVIHRKDVSTFTKILDRPMLGFFDFEKVGGFPNETFSLVIIVIIGKVDVYWILIDGGSSCDIMYLELLEKMALA